MHRVLSILCLALALITVGCESGEQAGELHLSLTPVPSVYGTDEVDDGGDDEKIIVPVHDKEVEPMPQEYIVECNEYLNLREAPDADSDKIGEVRAKDKVKLLGLYGRFAHIETENGETGYILSGYMEPIEKDPMLEGEMIVKPTAKYTYEMMMADLEALQKAYPDMLTVVEAGKSSEGRSIPVAIVADASAKNRIFVQAAIHAREHMTSAIAMAQLERLLVSGIIADTEVHIMPMANPDGVTISQTALPSELLIQSGLAYDDYDGDKASSAKTYYEEWKANALGVDLNRNFPAGFENVDTAKAPAPDGYRGSSAASEVETKVLMDYTESIPFDATMSYHSMGSELYYEFGPNSPLNERSSDFSDDMSELTGFISVPSDGTSFGGYKDWAIETMGIPSLTVEMGSRSAPLDEGEFPMLWLRTRDMLYVAADWVKGEGLND